MAALCREVARHSRQHCRGLGTHTTRSGDIPDHWGILRSYRSTKRAGLSHLRLRHVEGCGSRAGLHHEARMPDARMLLSRGAWRRVLLRAGHGRINDWMPTHEHFPLSKKDGGHRLVDNTILAHRLCNRIDYSISVRGRPNPRDLERVRKAREEAIRRRRS
jgi:hypothetical protein